MAQSPKHPASDHHHQAAAHHHAASHHHHQAAHQGRRMKFTGRLLGDFCAGACSLDGRLFSTAAELGSRWQKVKEVGTAPAR